jgi:hypothetical protein
MFGWNEIKPHYSHQLPLEWRIVAQLERLDVLGIESMLLPNFSCRRSAHAKRLCHAPRNPVGGRIGRVLNPLSHKFLTHR